MLWHAMQVTMLASAICAWPFGAVGSATSMPSMTLSHVRPIQGHGGPATTPLVAVALRGDIYVIPAGGGAPRRLTT